MLRHKNIRVTTTANALQSHHGAEYSRSCHPRYSTYPYYYMQTIIVIEWKENNSTPWLEQRRTHGRQCQERTIVFWEMQSRALQPSAHCSSVFGLGVEELHSRGSPCSRRFPPFSCFPLHQLLFACRSISIGCNGSCTTSSREFIALNSLALQANFLPSHPAAQPMQGWVSNATCIATMSAHRSMISPHMRIWVMFS